MKKTLAAFLLLTALLSVDIGSAQAPLTNEEAPAAAFGGGGFPAPPPVLSGGVYVLTLDLMKQILEEMDLTSKPFHVGPPTLAATLSSAGEYPAPTYPFLTALLTTPVEEVASPERLVRDITVLSPDTTEEYYSISTRKVLIKYFVARTVFLARRDPPVDGMASIGWSRDINAPILPVEQNSIPEATSRALKRLRPERIILLGGPEAISDKIKKKLSGIAKVERVWGLTRYGTAVELAKEIESPSVVVITDGSNPSVDALIIAGAYKAPIVYVHGREIPKVTEDYLLKNKESKIYKAMSWVIVGVDREASTEIKALYDLPEFLTKHRVFKRLYKTGSKILSLATGGF
jgi:putative cell wall-binding protein